MGQNTASKAAVKLYRHIIVPEPCKHNAEGAYAIHTRNLHVRAFGAVQAPAQQPNASAVLELTVKQCCILAQQLGQQKVGIRDYIKLRAGNLDHLRHLNRGRESGWRFGIGLAGNHAAKRKGQRRKPAANKVRLCPELNGWSLFGGPG